MRRISEAAARRVDTWRLIIGDTGDEAENLAAYGSTADQAAWLVLEIAADDVDEVLWMPDMQCNAELICKMVG